MIHRCMPDLQGIELFMTGEPVFVEDRCDQARSRASIKISKSHENAEKREKGQLDQIRFRPMSGINTVNYFLTATLRERFL